MKARHSILISSAGRRASLLQCFREDAKRLDMRLNIIAADASPSLSAACHLADAKEAVPICRDIGYVPALLAICQRHSIDLLVPTIDTELMFLSQQAAAFSAVGTRVLISAPEVVAVARDKLSTALILHAAGVNVPRTLPLADYRANPTALAGELVAKPAGGSSSVGIVRGRKAADFARLPSDGYIVQEYWEGAEYTVNMFFDQHGRMRCAIPHRRIEVRAGEVAKGRTQRVPQLDDAARKIASSLTGARGPLCFQAIVKDSGEYAIFEINARFGGGYPLAHRAGARFTQWLLEEVAGLPCTANNDWKDGVTMLRYDQAVFLDE